MIFFWNFQANLIEYKNIIIDSKSGVSGAGLDFSRASYILIRTPSNVFCTFTCINFVSHFWCLVHCAGRGAKVANLYTELTEGIMSYGVTGHRHGEYQS